MQKLHLTRRMMVKTAVMPKGVEHPWLCYGFYLYCYVKTAVMPKGVEHILLFLNKLIIIG